MRHLFEGGVYLSKYGIGLNVWYMYMYIHVHTQRVSIVSSFLACFTSSSPLPSPLQLLPHTVQVNWLPTVLKGLMDIDNEKNWRHRNMIAE